MAIVFACPSCAKQLQVSDAAAGRSSKCPYCKGPITVPQAQPQAMAVTASLPSALPATPAPPPPPLATPASPGTAPPFLQRVDRGLKRFGPWGYVAAGVAALVVVLVLILLVVRLFAPGSGLDHASRYFPANTNLVVAANVDDILSSSLYKDLKKSFPEIEAAEKEMTQKGEIGIQDYSQIFFACNVDAVDKEGLIVVSTLKRRTAVTFPNSRKGPEAGGVTIYEAADHRSCQVDSTTIVQGNGPSSTLEGILSRKKTELSPAMKNACKDADFSRSVTLVVSFQGASKQGAFAQALGDNAQAVLDALESLVVNANLGSSDITVQAVATCKDTKSAEDIRKLAEGGVAMAKLGGNVPKEVKDLLGQLKFDQKGAQVRLSVKITKDQITALSKMK